MILESQVSPFQMDTKVGLLRIISLSVAFILLACGLLWFCVQLVGDNILGLQIGWLQGFLLSVATILSFACACGPKGRIATVLHLLFGCTGALVFVYILAVFDFRQVMPWPYYFIGSLGTSTLGHLLSRDSKFADSVDSSELNVDSMG